MSLSDAKMLWNILAKAGPAITLDSLTCVGNMCALLCIMSQVIDLRKIQNFENFHDGEKLELSPEYEGIRERKSAHSLVNIYRELCPILNDNNFVLSCQPPHGVFSMLCIVTNDN